MIKPEDMSLNFVNLLLAAGWTPLREIDASAWMRQLTDEGFTPLPVASDILRSLGGMTVKLPPAGLNPYEHELFFDPVRAATGEYDRVREWEDELNIKLFPVAEEMRNGNVIWAGNDGRFYFGRGFGLYIIGDSFRDAMDQVAFPAKSAKLAVP